MTGLTVLYDERCALCCAAAARLSRRGGAVRAEPIGSEAGALLLAGVSPERRYDAVHAIDETGGLETGALAVAAVLGALPGGRVPAALVRRCPRLAERLYRLLAAHRNAFSEALQGGVRLRRALARRSMSRRRHGSGTPPSHPPR